jgi:ribosomal protein L7/L12
VIISSSVNKLALVVAVFLAAEIVWFGISTHDLLLSVFGIALLVVGPFVRRTDPAASAAAFRARVDQLQAMPAPPAAAATATGATTIPGMSPQVLAQLMAGNKIGAIKRYREEYGSGLKDAKDAVDAFERQLLPPG